MNIRKTSISLSLLLGVALAAATAPAMASGSDNGQTLYTDNCAMCHGPGGKGAIPGAPNFTKADGVLTQSDTVLTKRILEGFSSPGSSMAMPAMQGRVDKAQVHEILEYMHKTFGVSSGGKKKGD